MPIYEYRATGKGCRYCRDGFEIKQRIDAKPLSKCPKCQAPIRKLVSRFRTFVAGTPDEASATEKKIREFEKGGRWSHAAELADKSGLEDRARENYKKAGYEM
ncbi:MAG: zinc ribbon domain-containing protein [Euryarchaeota archaeon]|nr:zinc ribbon domain-containing protein [Euryarchaeota archaeon]